MNVPDANRSYSKPPLGQSDHNMVHLVPTYKQKLKQSKPVTRMVKTWSDDCITELQACFDCTDWDLLMDGGLENNVDTVSEYIKFCEDMIVPQKQVKCFPNNKPCVTKDLKETLNKKKAALSRDDRGDIRDVSHELQSAIRSCKDTFKCKLEAKFQSNNTRDAWRALKQITGFGLKSQGVGSNDDSGFANELNQFYSRFDNQDFSTERETIHRDISSDISDCPSVIVSEDSVRKCLKNINPNKARGPDGIAGRVLKECSSVLAPVFRELPNLSRHTQSTVRMEDLQHHPTAEEAPTGLL